MIPRRWSRLVFLLFFLLVVLVLYNMLQSLGNNNEGDHAKRKSMGAQLDHLAKSISDLHKTIKEEEQPAEKPNVRPIPPPPSSRPVNVPERPAIEVPAEEKPQEPTKTDERCLWRNTSPSNTTFEIRQLYEKLPFDDKNGGVWKQGFDITYDTSQWTPEKKLKIILMPHSHCDPGWLFTFEEYFNRATKNIIDTVINALNLNKKYKFIWAEMSYLSLWWDQASPDQRESLKKLVHNKQLEIVTGGWVMNDEANTHYFAMLDQLIEGHQFIENNLGNITLQSGWANDPFGYSPTMAYLLHGMGFQYMTIQRVHYHIKKALAKAKQFEFYWQQSWDRTMSTRILTHVMPFYSYDVPHTCGPDPKICCQFDFRRAAGSDMNCPWGINPVSITNDNVRERAQTLLDQYRKKAQLYRTNILFVQLGDDFRYVTMDEAKKQYENYDRLFTYMNEQSDWNVDAQFGTLSEFFQELAKQTEKNSLPSYMGDFFTYADRTDHYWSGYYTSRAFFKRMDRIVESYLRASEILFSVAHVKMLEKKTSSSFPSEKFFEKLVRARRNLGLFQHHDGVTGTAKDHVVNDYGEKLLTAIRSAQTVMEQAAAYLLDPNNYSSDVNFLQLDRQFATFDSLPTRKPISLNKQGQSIRVVQIYNPTDQRRVEIVKILVDTFEVSVTSDQKSISACQINPKWTGKKSNVMDPNLFELLILVDIESYSLKEYTIHLSARDQACPLATIEYFDETSKVTNTSAPFPVNHIDKKVIQLSNNYLSISFSRVGKIINVHHLQHNEKISFNINAIRYGTSQHSDHNSGAYLFLPDGEAQDIPLGPNDLVRIQRGPLTSQIDILHEMFVLRYQLSNTNGLHDTSIEVSASTRLTMNQDTELALRLTTGIKNGAEFFTDLNGFQTVRRKTYSKIPLQGNVYPMPTMAYIEDDHMRLTVLSGQPSGVGCLQSGVMDVFLDRRLLRDDNRGLGQGVTDNREILSRFRILFEPRRTIADRTSLTGYPTLLAHHQSMELLYPLHTFHSTSNSISFHELNLFSKVNLFPSDYHLVNLRTLNEHRGDSSFHPSNNIALIVRRFAYDCDETFDRSFRFEQPIFEHFFSANQIDSIVQTSLSLRHVKQSMLISSKLDIPMAELMTYKLKIK